MRFAGLPNAQPALDSTSREKWYQHRPTAAYRLGLGFGRSDKLRWRAALQLKGAGKSLREKPAAIVAFGIADLPLQPVLRKPLGATNSPTNSADEADVQTKRATTAGRLAHARAADLHDAEQGRGIHPSMSDLIRGARSATHAAPPSVPARRQDRHETRR